MSVCCVCSRPRHRSVQQFLTRSRNPASAPTPCAKDCPVSDTLSFKYTLTKADVVSSQHSQLFRSRLLWVMLGLIALMMAYGFYNQFEAVLLGRRAWTSLLRMFLTFGALGITWWASNWLYAYWLARRSPEVGVEKELIFTDTGMTSRSVLEYSESTWANFTSVLETDEYFLLYRGRAEFVPIPKRDLAESMAQDRFRELLRTKIRDARLLA